MSDEKEFLRKMEDMIFVAKREECHYVVVNLDDFITLVETAREAL